MRIAIHSNAAWGGIVDYMVEQARAICEAKHEVILLVPENFNKEIPAGIRVFAILPNIETLGKQSKLTRRFNWVKNTRKSWEITTSEITFLAPDALLLSAFAEYLSPLWKHNFSSLRHKLPNLKIGAIVHDPVRQPFGPGWFHRLSVRNAFEILDAAFVHGNAKLDQFGANPPTSIHKVPHGISRVTITDDTPEISRELLGISNEKTVFLVFGHVRDEKNIDLAVRAISSTPEAHIIIAGKVTSSRERPVSFYKDLAKELCVEPQVTFIDRFICDKETSALFNASDVILLAYGANFLSASGVLHVALNFRKPVLATSGEGHLKWAVKKYSLGIWTKPDSLEALIEAMQQLVNPAFCLNAKWEDYENENTWRVNARKIISVFQGDNVKLTH